MRKLISVIVSVSILCAHTVSFAAIATVESKKEWKAQIFLANQIKGIGLVDSYQEDNENRSYVYDNSLAAMACMASGNFGLAKEILDTLTKEVLNADGGVPYESYLYSDTSGIGTGLAFAGNSAWLLQALNVYQKLQKSSYYYTAQKKLADFLISIQDPSDGGIRGNIFEFWKSTEHNMVAYVALRNFGRLYSLTSYITAANKIKAFLISPAVWNGAYFNAGPSDPARFTDVQAYGVLTLGAAYANALTFAENYMKSTKIYANKYITGFDFNDDRDTVWFEGTLQMAFAFYKYVSLSKATYYYNESVKGQTSDGSLVLATNQGTTGFAWILMPWRAAAPTAWLIFYSLKFNPLIIY